MQLKINIDILFYKKYHGKTSLEEEARKLKLSILIDGFADVVENIGKHLTDFK